MDSFSSRDFPSDWNKAIEELNRGREIAKDLLLLLSSPPKKGCGGVVSAEDLVDRLLGSFSSTISILNSVDLDEVFQVLTTDHTLASSPFWDGRKWEDSTNSCKTSATRDRRGCYKRRKASETWIKETPNLVDDGHAWRKYGQKDIQNSQHPRSYFRCTNKYDQGCVATKQVQMVEEDPPLYRTTYHGRHTCDNFLRTPQLILDSTVGDSSMISFKSANPNPNNKQNDHNPFPSSAASIPFSSVKQEGHYNYKKEVSSTFNKNQPPSSDYFLSPDRMSLGTTEPMARALLSGSNHGNVISTAGVNSCTDHNVGMDNIVGTLDFEDFLQFEC